MINASPLFFGRVRGGRLRFDDLTAVREHVRALEGQEVEAVIRRKRSQRSLDQNAYLHAVPITLLCEHLGYTMQEMKLIVLGECFGHKDTPYGPIPIKPSTSDLTVEEFSRLIDFLLMWGPTEHNVVIPGPNEVELT